MVVASVPVCIEYKIDRWLLKSSEHKELESEHMKSSSSESLM